MRRNRPKDLLRDGAVAIGTWLLLESDLAAELVTSAGFDWAIVDMEHGPVSADGAQRLITAIRTTRAAPLVRVTWNESSLIQAAFDMGAYGVLVPYVNSRREAERAVRDGRYPPLGARSRGGLRAPLAFETDAVTYGRAANDATLLMVQIETATALGALEEIAAVDGIDVLFVGPGDLAESMGVWPPNMREMPPAYAAAIERVPRVARAHGKHAGILVYDVEVAKRCVDLGYTFVGIGSDATMLQGAAAAIAEAPLRDDGWAVT
jgi:2-keto-3-deoxy-L-rhamnonate aldolase RhmA